jgi:hypothetical protein
MANDRKVKTNEERQADAELEDLFKDIDGTLIVKVDRLEPEYAEGYCGKFNVTAGKPLTLEMIKTRFGGRTFKVVARDSGGKYKQQKVISISGLPRDEGRVINRDGSLQPEGVSEQSGNSPTAAKTGFGNIDKLETIAGLSVSPKAKRMLLAEILGVSIDDKKNESQSQSVIDMMNIQAMMKFQQDMDESKQRQREADLRYERSFQEMRREEMAWRREIGEGQKPKDTFGGLQDMIKVFREMNGFKEELGAAGNEGIAQTLISSTIPMMENMMAEFMKLQQMKLQLSLQAPGQTPTNAGPPPELPARVSTPRANTSLRVVDDSVLDDDQELEQFARRFGTVFKKMDPEKRQRMMNAFLQGEQNIDRNPDNDTIETDDIDDIELLSDEDRELLDHDVEDQQDENDHVSDSKHARSTDDNDPDNSEGHQSGGAVSAN